MSVAPVGKTNSDNPDVQRLGDQTARTLRGLADSVIGQGVLIGPVDLNSLIVNKVSHKLGRIPLGYIVVKKDTDAIIWDDPSTMADKFLFLNTDADVTATFWVF